MKRRNARFSIEMITVRISCNQCNRRFESPDGSLYWDKPGIGKQMHEKLVCPDCSTINQLPERLINLAAGFLGGR